MAGFLLDPALLEERPIMEGLAIHDIYDAAERILRRLYFDADNVFTLICEFHASLKDLEQRRGSFSCKFIRPDPLLKAGNISKWH